MNVCLPKCLFTNYIKNFRMKLSGSFMARVLKKEKTLMGSVASFLVRKSEIVKILYLAKCFLSLIPRPININILEAF